VYGQEYIAGATALTLLCIGLAADALTSPLGLVVTMTGRSRTTFFMSLAALVINVSLNALLIPPFGLSGAGTAWAMSLVALALMRTVIAASILGTHEVPSMGHSDYSLL
jgi:O-antigen/teichoic acid export membrane protein